MSVLLIEAKPRAHSTALRMTRYCTVSCSDWYQRTTVAPHLILEVVLQPMIVLYTSSSTPIGDPETSVFRLDSRFRGNDNWENQRGCTFPWLTVELPARRFPHYNTAEFSLFTIGHILFPIPPIPLAIRYTSPAGKTTRKVEPRSFSLSTLMRPPIRATRRLTRAKPRPVPW